MKSSLKRALPLLLVLVSIIGVAACNESLDSGAACPALCPEPATEIRDTTIFAVELDTVIGGFPPLGTEAEFALTWRPDTLETAIIARYDSLPARYQHQNAPEDSAIVSVDSAMVKLRVSRPDTLGPTITVEVYDVDTLTAGEDTSAAVLGPLFAPHRLLGSATFTAEEYRDSIRVPISDSAVLAKIQLPDSVRRMRVGIRIVALQSAEIQVFSSNFGGAAPLLYYRASPDTQNVPALQVGPTSLTPDNAAIAADLADFQITLEGPADPAPDALRVGGAPARRVYVRFALPSGILDSSTIVRATLFLTQRPVTDAPQADDTVAVQALRIHASNVVTDIARALLFITLSQDSTLVVPSDSGVHRFELANHVKLWAGTDPTITPRAIALRAANEGIDGRFVDFFSNEAPVEVRPRLRIVYARRPAPGLP